MVKNLIVLLFGISLALLAAEIILRFTRPQETYTPYQPVGNFSCYEKGTYYWARLKPNVACILHSNVGDFSDITIKTNSLGLRNKEVQMTKPEGLQRTLFIGDSFTFGWGVQEDESYPRIIEQALKQNGSPVEVINAGRPSNSPSNYYLYLINDGLKLDPDVVIVGFDIFNDLSDSAYDEVWSEKDASGLPTKVVYSSFYVDSQGRLREKNIPLKFAIPVLKYSRLFGLFTDFFLPPKQSIVNNEQKLQEEAIARIEGLFKAMNDVLNERGKKLLIIMIPMSIEVDEDVRLASGLPRFTSGIHPLIAEFSLYFSKNNIEFINLLPRFVQSQERNNLYYKKDGHGTVAGQKFAAELISERLLPYLEQR